MRFVKCEKIFLSQNESDTWTNFDEILEGLERGSENPETKNLIHEIQNLLTELWAVVEDIEQEEN